MIRILHIVTSLSASGVPSVIYNFYSHMDRSLVHFDFVAIPSNVEHPYRAKFEQLGSKVFYMPKKYSGRPMFLYRLMKKGKYDIVHSHIELASGIYLSIAKAAGVKVRIAHAHMAFLPYTKFSHKCLRYILNHVATLKMGCSKDAIRGLFGNENGVVLHNAIDTSKFKYNPLVREKCRKELGINQKTVIGFVGRLTYQKNIFYLLDIFNEYLKYNANSVLLLIGDGEEKERFFAQVKEKNISDKVLFLGARNDVPSLMMAMDCLLLPSRWEGLGMVLVEAQATGLKCYTSLNTVPYEDTKITSCIRYLDINEAPCKWAEEMNKDSLGFDERKDMKELLVLHHYDIDQEANCLYEIYKKLYYEK